MPKSTSYKPATKIQTFKINDRKKETSRQFSTHSIVMADTAATVTSNAQATNEILKLRAQRCQRLSKSHQRK